MISLVYGNGQCVVNGSGIRAVEIAYTGKVELTDITDDSFNTVMSNTKIVIFPVAEGHLEDLFEYEGNLRIKYARVLNDSYELIQPSIVINNNVSEFFNTNAESITIKAENTVGFKYGKKVINSTIKKHIKENLHTSTSNIALFLGADKYEGYYHTHNDNTYMTGAIHTKDSKILDIK